MQQKTTILLIATSALLSGLPEKSLADEVPADLRVASLLTEQELLHRSRMREALVDPGDLRPEARRIQDVLSEKGWRAVPLQPPLFFSLGGWSTTIRVWRRSLGGESSCAGPVEEIPLEEYVRGVLPHEWIASWPQESLKAGAVAIRTYALAWVARGGKYSCADVCDTVYSQVYKDERSGATDRAVEATLNQVLLLDSDIVFAEYSAENGDPTKTGVSDLVCAGRKQDGHGRGMCQWGSKRWAERGESYDRIAMHYYPGATLWSPSEGSDGGPPWFPDGWPRAHDAGVVPSHDGGGLWRGAQPPIITVEGGCAVGGSEQRAPLTEGCLLLLLAVLACAARFPRRR